MIRRKTESYRKENVDERKKRKGLKMERKMEIKNKGKGGSKL